MSRYSPNRQSGMSERMRDPAFRRRSRSNRRSIYGGVPPPTGGPKVKPAGRRPDPISLADLARRTVHPAYAANRAVIDRLLQREDEDARAKSAYMQRVYENFARFLQAMPGQTQQIYGDAAGRIAEFGRGNEAAMQGQEDASAQGVNDVLKLIGAPQGQAPADLGAAERLYALTGYLPASKVEGQGAAFATYAAGLPGIYAQKGIQDIAAFMAESGKRKRDISDKLLELEAQEAADIVKQTNLLRGEREEKRTRNQALREQKRQFNLELKFRRDVARAQDLIDQNKAALSVKEVESRIAESQRRLRIAQQNADTSAINAETSRLRALQGAKQDAISARNENQRIVISEYNSGTITQREMQRRLGNPRWRTYPAKKKPVGSNKPKGKPTGSDSGL